MLQLLATCLALFSFAFFPSLLWASEALSPRLIALGGSGQSDGTVEDAAFTNPSLLARLPFYAVSFGTALPSGLYQLAVQLPAHATPIPLALGWAKKEEGNTLVLASSYPLGDRASLGLSVPWLQTSGSTSASFFNLNLSFSLQPTDSWTIALIANSILDTGGPIPGEYLLATRFRIHPSLSTHLAVRSIQSQIGFSAGLESHLFEYFFLRLGLGSTVPLPISITASSPNGTYLSCGLGLALPNASLNYSLYENTANFGNPSHLVGGSVYY